MKKRLIAAALMLLWIFIMSIDDIAWGADYYSNRAYERSVRVACEKHTRVQVGQRYKLDTTAAKKCFYWTVKIDREEALLNSQIELNKALTKRLDRNQRW